ncbi:hypothetical protein [Cystobacter fuscus]|uniref:hypothetical protein n=1 Tax=Cystobacter fuscus TaxID=43 RepID=UPI002B2F6EFB|nr:hypothetical protein F0U63_23595 [Cystobacter fuscus]
MRAEARAHGWVALLAAVLLSTGCVTLSGEELADVVASAGPVPQERPSCGGQAVPAGWPDFSSHDSQALLAPFLACSSPAEYVALQEHVDMPRLVESLTDWDAVRLGSLGPVREDAAGLLNRKRLSFLLLATDKYGVAPPRCSSATCSTRPMTRSCGSFSSGWPGTSGWRPRWGGWPEPVRNWRRAA